MQHKTPDYSLIVQNWPLKLLALFIGITLWYGIVAEDQVDMVLTVPLEMRNLPPNMVIANQFRKDLEVSVRGPKRLLQEMQQQNISRPVNLADTQPGPVVIQNPPESIPFPRSITVQRVQPANITPAGRQAHGKEHSDCSQDYGRTGQRLFFGGDTAES